MDNKVEKELAGAQDDLKEAIHAEKERGASASELKQQSIDLEGSLTDFEKESAAAKNRIWWKSAKWMLIAGIFVSLILLCLFCYIYVKLRQLKHSMGS
ncbi:hypothetical protein NEDG_00360 [Nematocida displodere]|uniref:V-SNARE coiled-coil homology domain-containing protein n=1 Tax=Nematocida displodere TaxID=1805483 RepID=A0A177EIV7_9MICR|nr:hypothetical protein NEDG_00360 [Nematocida displodere]